MADGAGTSPGEWGGIIGGAITLLGMAGACIAWLFGRGDQRRRTREEKLEAWHAELKQRERDLDEGRTAYTKQLEDRLGLLESSDEARDTQMRALRIAFELVSAALRKTDSQNPALGLAEDVIRAAFPPSVTTPADMIESLIAIEKRTA